MEAAPVGGPVVIPPSGGRFRFRVRLTNTGDEAATVSGGTAVYLPGGALHGPLLERAGVVVPPHASVTASFTQRVPPRAPAGAYEYVVYTGAYPSFDQAASFPFTKEAEATTAASRRAAFGLTGWTVEEVAPFALEGMPAVASAVEVAGGVGVGPPYPNPARGLVSVPVRVPAVSEVEVVVYDALGRRVGVAVRERLEAGAHAVVLDVGGLPSGVYLVRVVAGAEAAVQRLVVAR